MRRGRGDAEMGTMRSEWGSEERERLRKRARNTMTTKERRRIKGEREKDGAALTNAQWLPRYHFQNLGKGPVGAEPWVFVGPPTVRTARSFSSLLFVDTPGF